MKLKFKFEVWSWNLKLSLRLKIEVDICSWRNLKMKKFEVEADNKVTCEKENSNSEKVCLESGWCKCENWRKYGCWCWKSNQQKLESNLELLTTPSNRKLNWIRDWIWPNVTGNYWVVSAIKETSTNLLNRCFKYDKELGCKAKYNRHWNRKQN